MHLKCKGKWFPRLSGAGMVLLSYPASRPGPGASNTCSLINQSLDKCCVQGGSMTLGGWQSLAEGNSGRSTSLKAGGHHHSQHVGNILKKSTPQPSP